MTDGLGRLMQVVEDPFGAAYQTNYSYDVLDDLTTVSQGVQTRSFVYDSLNRLTAVTSGATTNFYGYDALGRVSQSFQRTDGVDYGFSYAYNLVGALTSMTYPSGRVVTTNYDAAGRISQVSGVKGAASTTYASSFAYAPHGAIQSLTLGNGLIESTQFNNRLQPTNISLGSLLNLAYNYGLTNNNGNVLSMTITPGTGQTPISQTFTYDALNRLQSGSETVSGSQTWKQTNGFDQYGNRRIDQFNTTGNVMGPISSQADLSASNNRIVKAGYAYDAVGNMISEPGKSYTFDGENKIVTANVGGAVSTYVYDGDGKRVKKITPQGTTVMVYDASSRLIAEYADTPPSGPGGTEYATADHLGTPRVWTNSSGAVVSGGRHDYLPFGEELFSGLGGRTTAQGYSPSAQTDGQRNQFTLKERDSETNLDYFLARYYSSAQGRFISPDEFGGGPVEFFAAAASANPTFYADLTNPQTLNKYQYSFNNPLRYVDPDGHDPTDPDDGTKPQKRLNSEQESVAKVISGTIVCGPLCGFINLLIDPPAAGDDSEPPTVKEAVKAEATDAALGLIIPGGGKAKALEQRAVNQLEKRFMVTLGRDITKTEAMADIIAVAKSRKSAVVQEVTTGAKSITKVREQLEGGIRHLLENGFKGKIEPIVRTTDRRLAARIRKELREVMKREVKVILDK